MLDRYDTQRQSRHARLFELIRQRNLAEAARSRPVAGSVKGPVDEFHFLKQAEQSFSQSNASVPVL